MKKNRVAKMILFFIILAPLFAFAIGSIVMLLWNYALVPVLHISTVTFWQALGILVLSKILFSSFGGRHRHRGGFMKERMMWNSMTPEQKQKLKEEWKNRMFRGRHGCYQGAYSGGQEAATGSQEQA